jgi:hypothetical protein
MLSRPVADIAQEPVEGRWRPCSATDQQPSVVTFMPLAASESAQKRCVPAAFQLRLELIVALQARRKPPLPVNELSDQPVAGGPPSP